MIQISQDIDAVTLMPAYISHKKVWAIKIKSVTPVTLHYYDNTTDSAVEVTFEDSLYAPRIFSISGKPTPEAGWYLVQYQDGYISFSPEKAFEEGHTKANSTFAERVIAEKVELGTKATKLAMFIGTGAFNDLPEEEKDRLKRQLKIMDEYCQVLDERIAAFPR
jgi:hypothetical protein